MKKIQSDFDDFLNNFKKASDFSDLKMIEKCKWLNWLTLALKKIMLTDFM